MPTFAEELRTQRWDDHRYYHHSRINQTLHLISAISFLCAYALAFTDPALAALIGWLVSMTSRQAGHFFFEPKGYDHINHATHEHKEEIKVGYNLQRKIVLMTIWALSPVVIYLNPTLFGLFEPHKTAMEFIRHVALLWLFIGIGGLAVPHRAPVLHPERPERPGVGDENPHRPVPRHQALLQGAAGPAARRTDRPAACAASRRRRRAARAAGSGLRSCTSRLSRSRPMERGRLFRNLIFVRRSGAGG